MGVSCGGLMMPLLVSRRAALAAFAGVPASLVCARAENSPTPIAVTKDPGCGCCDGWAEHLRRAGFKVTVTESETLAHLKSQLGIPAELRACHTARVGNYVVEGHVPAAAIVQLLRDAPQATGLAVPGMPVGSPGMEAGGATPEVYEVFVFGRSGQRSFGRYRGSEKI
jgi:hypothetical protein